MKYLLILLFLSVNANAAQLILGEQTTAGNSAPVRVSSEQKATLILYAPAGIDAATDFPIQISHNNGITWQNLVYGEVTKALSDGNMVETIYGPGVFRVQNPGSLTNATGIYTGRDGDL